MKLRVAGNDDFNQSGEKLSFKQAVDQQGSVVRKWQPKESIEKLQHGFLDE